MGNVYYLVTWHEPIDGPTWVALADAVEAALNQAGIEARGINNQSIDRDIMAARDGHNGLDGLFVGASKSTDGAERVIRRVIVAFGLTPDTVTIS